VTGSAHDESRPAGAGPETVRVIRPGHPLHGLDLPVWGWLRLRGVAMVVLVLPDGSKERIPAAWVGESGGENPAAPVVAAAADLLQLLRVISGVAATAGNRAEQAARQSPGKEDDRAACTTESAAGPGSGATIAAGQPAALAVAQAAAAIVARLIIQAAQPGSPACPATPVPAPAGAAQQGVSGGE
jgi:hypothetical protein